MWSRYWYDKDKANDRRPDRESQLVKREKYRKAAWEDQADRKIDRLPGITKESFSAYAVFSRHNKESLKDIP